MDSISLDLGILESFHTKCKENNIWYSLAGSTLLSAKLNKNFVEKNTYEVFMKDKDFIIFSQKYKDNIVDNSLYNNFFLLNPFYIEDNSNYVIKINLIIEANSDYAEKIYTIKNLLRQKIGYYKTSKSADDFKQKLDKLFLKFLGLFWSPLSWEEISSKIYTEKNDGFFIIDSFSGNINANWLPSLPREDKEIIWGSINFNSLYNDEIYLIKKFGFNWMSQPEIKKNNFDYSFIQKWK